MILAESYDEYVRQCNGKPKLTESEFNELMQAICDDDRSEREINLENKLVLAKQAISRALNFLACADRISETECNEQLAFDVLRKTLEELDK